LLEGPRRGAIAGCGLVALLDGGQLVAGGLDGQWPALGGAVLYVGLGLAMAAGRREAAWVLVVMPWVPLLAVVAWTIGLSPVAPHPMMGVVALVQLGTGFAAAQALNLQGPPLG